MGKNEQYPAVSPAECRQRTFDLQYLVERKGCTIIEAAELLDGPGSHSPPASQSRPRAAWVAVERPPRGDRDRRDVALSLEVFA